MLRQRLSDDLKESLKAKDARSVSTLRLILSALKDRDIAARVKGNTTGVADGEVVDMLQKMVAQRRDSIEMYQKGNRPDLVQQETEEIAVIQRYMPQGLSEFEIADAIAAAITAVGATTVKDMGKVMASLKEQFAGRMDFAKAGALVKQRLG